MTAVHHTLDVYDVELHLATTRPEWRALRRKHPWIESAEDHIGLTVSAGRTPEGRGINIHHVVFWIDLHRLAKEPPGVLVNVVAHEASHAAGRILDSANHPLPELTDEPHAYLIAWITRWMWEECSNRLAALHA